VDATTYPLLQYDQLMPERHVLCFKSTLRLERRDQEKQSSAIIAAGVGRFSYLMNTDEVFGSTQRMEEGDAAFGLANVNRH
jgi:hypothetical protein